MAKLPMSGRRRQAGRNDDAILAAAREVFLADPDAPMAQVGARAGVGMSALYRRHASKQDLLRALAHDALSRYLDDLRQALEELGEGDTDPDTAWSAYTACLMRVVDGRSQALAQRLAGTFHPTPELTALAGQVGNALADLHERTQRAGALRADVSTADVTLILEAIMLIEVPHEALRQRYLTLFIQALRAPAQAELPGDPADDRDLARRWRRASE